MYICIFIYTDAMSRQKKQMQNVYPPSMSTHFTFQQMSIIFHFW